MWKKWFEKKNTEAGNSIGYKPLVRKAMARTLVFMLCAATAVTTLNFSFAAGEDGYQPEPPGEKSGSLTPTIPGLGGMGGYLPGDGQFVGIVPTAQGDPATDLAYFVVQPLTVTDSEGNVIPTNSTGTYIVGDNYAFNISFRDSLTAFFRKNMTYNIPAGLTLSSEQPMSGDIYGIVSGHNIKIGEYTINAETGEIFFTFTDDYLTNGNKTLRFELNAKFEGGSGTKEIDFGGGVKITVKVDDPPSGLKVEKSAVSDIGKIDKDTKVPEAKKSADYSILITNTGTVDIKDIVLTDIMEGPAVLTQGITESPSFLTSIYYSVNGDTPVQITSPNWVSAEPRKAAFNIIFPPSVVLKPGDTILVTYTLDFDPLLQGWEGVAGSGVDAMRQYETWLNNEVTVVGKNPQGDPVKEDDQQAVFIYSKFLNKWGKPDPLTKTITWTMLIGDGETDLRGKTITEELGPGLSFHQEEDWGNTRHIAFNFHPDNPLIYHYGPDNHCGPPFAIESYDYVGFKNTFDWDWINGGTGITFTVPTEKLEFDQEKQGYIDFYEGYDGIPPLSYDGPIKYISMTIVTDVDYDTYPDGGTFKNNLSFDDPNLHIGPEVKIGLPGVSEIEKTGLLYGYDEVDGGHYVEWTVNTIIPGALWGIPVWFEDSILSWNTAANGNWGRRDPVIRTEDFASIKVDYYNDFFPDGKTMMLGEEYTIFGNFGNNYDYYQNLNGFVHVNNAGRGGWQLYFVDASNYNKYYSRWVDVKNTNINATQEEDSLSPFSVDTTVIITFRMYIDEMKDGPFSPDWTHEDSLKVNNGRDTYLQNKATVKWQYPGKKDEEIDDLSKITWPIFKSGEVKDDGSIEYQIWLNNDMLKRMYETGNPVFFEDEFDDRFEYVENSFVLTKELKDAPTTRYGPYNDDGIFNDLIFKSSGAASSFKVNLYEMRRVGIGWSNGEGSSINATDLTNESHVENWFTDENFSYSIKYRIKPKNDEEMPIDQFLVKNAATISAEGVGTFPNDCIVKYGTPVVEKKMTTNTNSNMAKVAIEINPKLHKLILSGNATTYRVEDQMSDTLAFNLSTINLYKCNKVSIEDPCDWELMTAATDAVIGDDWTWQLLPGNRVELFLPDETHIKVEYDAFITATPNVDVDLWNSVEVNGTYTDLVEHKFKLNNADGFGGAKNGELLLYKNDSKGEDKRLKDAKFGIYVDAKYVESEGFSSFEKFVADQNIPSDQQTIVIDDRTFYIFGIAQTGIDGSLTFGGGGSDPQKVFQAMLMGYDYIFALAELETPRGYLAPEGTLAENATLIIFNQPNALYNDTPTRAQWLAGKKYSLVPGGYITISNEPVTIKINGNKIVQGPAAPNETIEFKLTQVKDAQGAAWTDGTPITRTVTVETTGAKNYSFEFPEIYGLPDDTYYFKIEEVVSDPVPGWTYDASEKFVTVVISESGTNIQYTGNGPTLAFTNTYTKPIDVALKAMKTAVGEEMGAGQFRFALYESNAAGDILTEAIQEKNNATSGNMSPVYFDSIKFTEAGEYYYLLCETGIQSVTPGGWTCDTREYLIRIIVTGSAGVLSADAKYDYRDNAEEAFKGVWKNYIEDIEEYTTWPVFANSYEESADPVSLTIKIAKTTNGKDITEGLFKFALYESDGDGEITEAALADPFRIALSGNTPFGSLPDYVSFLPITYDTPGDYYYVLNEVGEGSNGWEFDKTEFLIWVNVSENGSGQLVTLTKHMARESSFFEWGDWEDEHGPCIEYISDEETTWPIFLNNYGTGSASVEITGDKELLGSESTDKEFTFYAMQVGELGSEEKIGTLGGSATVEGVGHMEGDGEFTITIGGLTEADSPYYFMIYEDRTGDGVGGWSYSQNVFWVEVTVTDAGGGMAVAEITSDSGDTTFVNKFEPDPIEVNINILKTVTGKVPEADQFEFILYETNDKGVKKEWGYEQSKFSEAGWPGWKDGDIMAVEFPRPTISFNAPGEYYYVLKEVGPGSGGWKFDTTEYLFKINVELNDNDELVADVDYMTRDSSGDEWGEWSQSSQPYFSSSSYENTWPVFENSYSADSVENTIKAYKKAEGKQMTVGQFKFTLYNSDDTAAEVSAIESKGVDALGAASYVTFIKQTYSEEGVHYYLIKETAIAGDYPGWALDTSTVYWVCVTVTDDDGTLVVTTEYRKSEDGGVTFDDEWETSAETSHEFVNTYLTGGLSVTKTTVGGPSGQYFNFQIYESDGETPVDITGKYDFENGATEFLNLVDADLGKFKLQDGEGIVITGLDPGTYVVTELDGSGYSVSYLITGGSLAEGSSAEVDITSNGIAVVAFTNTYLTGGLSVTKTTVGGPSGQYFNFQIYESDGETPVDITGKYDFENGATEFLNLVDADLGKFKLQDGEGIVLMGLDPGTYVVTELDGSGYSISYLITGGSLAEGSSAEVDITSSGSAVVAFTNTYLTGGLQISKVVTGGGSTVRYFQFEIFESDGETPVDLSGYILDWSGGASSATNIVDAVNGIFQLRDGETLSITDIDPGTYIIVETSASGYKTTYSIDGGSPIEYDSAEVTVNDGESVSVIFTNEYDTSEIVERISVEVDKDTIKRTSAAFDGTGANVMVGNQMINNPAKGEVEYYRYDINFRSTSNVDADEFVVEDPLESVFRNHVRLEVLWTPAVWGDKDGRFNVWYKDAKGTGNSGKVAPTGPGPNGAITQVPDPQYPTGSEWKLWKTIDVRGEAIDPIPDEYALGYLWHTYGVIGCQMLSVSDLNFKDGDYVTALRFEFGAVKVGFTSKNYDDEQINEGIDGNEKGNGIRDTNGSEGFYKKNKSSGIIEDPPEPIKETVNDQYQPIVFAFMSFSGFMPMLQAFDILSLDDDIIDVPEKGSTTNWTPDEQSSFFPNNDEDSTQLLALGSNFGTTKAGSPLEPASYLVSAVGPMSGANIEIVSSASALIGLNGVGGLNDSDQDAVLTRVIVPFTTDPDIPDAGELVKLDSFLEHAKFAGLTLINGVWYDAKGRRASLTMDTFALNLWIILCVAALVCVGLLVATYIPVHGKKGRRRKGIPETGKGGGLK